MLHHARQHALLALITCLGLASAAEKSAALPAAPEPSAPLRALTIYPTRINLDGPRDEQWLGVIGEYADGTRRDLRRTARFTLAAETVAAVDVRGILHP